jgi:hypothetical protein
MALIVAADLAMHFATGIPVQVEIVVIVAALGGAFWFSKWYPKTKHPQHAPAIQ